jgi:hypothetical protein
MRFPRQAGPSALALWLGAAGWLCGQQDSWSAWNHAAAAAYQAKDYAAMRGWLLKMAAVAPAHPGVVYGLAAADALTGRTEAALGGLRAYAAMGLVRDPGSDPDFASLRGGKGLAEVLRRMEENKRPVSHSEVAFKLPAGLLTEDISYDSASGVFYVSSISQRKILRVGQGGEISDFVSGGPDDVWGVAAVVVDPERRLLWASTWAAPQAEDYRSADEGRSAVLRYDLRTGKLLKRYNPPAGEQHRFGDMALDGAGNLMVSDSFGPVYTIRRDSDALEVLVPAGVLVSPQTPAAAPDGSIFVADYGRGIAIIERGAQVSWLRTPKDLAATGIDGLYLAGRTLIALQNGTDPQRVIRLHLERSLRRVSRWEVIERNTPSLSEPTHGVVVGRAFYYIGRSGWDEWENDGARKAGVPARPPLILRTAALR